MIKMLFRNWIPLGLGGLAGAAVVKREELREKARGWWGDDDEAEGQAEGDKGASSSSSSSSSDTKGAGKQAEGNSRTFSFDDAKKRLEDKLKAKL